MPPPVGETDPVRVRRAEVARLYCQGWPQHRLADRFHVTQQQISLDLKAVRKEWQRVMVEEYDRIKSEQLAKIDAVEAEAWRGWRRSLRDAEKVTAKRDLIQPQPAQPDQLPPELIAGVTEETKVVEGQAGDPRFLQVIDSCVDRRLKVIGGYPDPKDKGDGDSGLAELIVRVLGPRMSMTDLCGGRVLGARSATTETQARHR